VHDLRHTFASLLLQQGESVVNAIVDEAMQREAAARLDAWMAAPPAAPSTATGRAGVDRWSPRHQSSSLQLAERAQNGISRMFRVGMSTADDGRDRRFSNEIE